MSLPEAALPRAAAISLAVAPSPTVPRFDRRTRVLLEAPIGVTLLKLAVPNVLVMFVQASVGVIDTYFVGWLGTDALPGVALDGSHAPHRSTPRSSSPHDTGVSSGYSRADPPTVRCGGANPG